MIEYDVRSVASPFPSLPSMTSAVPPPPLPFPRRRAAEPRFEQLGARYALPSLDPGDDTPARAEVAALRAAGLETDAYAACHLVCALRCCMPGDPLALGLWSSSALLSWCGATWATDPGDDGVTAHDHAEFLAAVRAGAVGPLRLLVPAPLDDAALAALSVQLPDYSLTCDILPGGAQRLALAPVARDDEESGAIGELSEPAVLADLLPSRLSRAVLLAQRWVERLGDPWIGVRDVPLRDEAASALLGSGWLQLLPDLPAWARTAPPGPAGVVDLFEHWRAPAPEPASAETIAALRARAGITWRLAYLAARDPRAGWAALLSTSDADALPAVVQGARGAGVTLLPPSVLRSGIDWEPDDAEPMALRAGLAYISGAASLAPGIVAERARGGPFTSLFDLARRVPELRAAPALPRQLVLAGALDDLHDRGVVLAQWAVVEEWCRALADAGVGSDDAAPLPDPALDPALSVTPDQAAIWTRALSPLAAALAGDAPLPRQIGDALLPSALPAAPPSGEPVRVAGAVLARRELHRDEQELVLLQVGDGAASIAIVCDAREGVEHEVGAWVAIDAVRSGAADAPLFVAAPLAVPRPPCMVEVVVPRLGDRESDLARLLQVQDLLERHPGGDTVHLYLAHAGRRRRLDTGAPLAIGWSPALRAALEDLLGPDTVEMLPADGQGPC